ncbi:response regulator [Haloplanus rallus]|jgi:DNA-binding response OmpR family regulator|uniref:Response regulator n=1 Tax=Haloplanus rallus TaxID=1816183 RepID=A0A6B9F801_9EURY|nr:MULTISPECIES: response regulator [Haloplanus]QGX94421.1 response regulator [Haloplanus rallus]
MTTTEGGTVLIVDDDREVVRTYRRYLETSYDVREAYDGEDALAKLDESVDVVLLDRLMPGVSGGEVLDRIRERDLGVRVAMVTAVDPDFDILEMGFDAYITKPTSHDELRSTIDELLSLNRHAEDVREYHSLLAKRAALREGKSTYELERSEAFADLEERIESLRCTLEAEAESYTDDVRFVATLRAIDDEAVGGDADG